MAPRAGRRGRLRRGDGRAVLAGPRRRRCGAGVDDRRGAVLLRRALAPVPAPRAPPPPPELGRRRLPDPRAPRPHPPPALPDAAGPDDPAPPPDRLRPPRPPPLPTPGPDPAPAGPV